MQRFNHVTPSFSYKIQCSNSRELMTHGHISCTKFTHRSFSYEKIVPSDINIKSHQIDINCRVDVDLVFSVKMYVAVTVDIVICVSCCFSPVHTLNLDIMVCDTCHNINNKICCNFCEIWQTISDVTVLHFPTVVTAGCDIQNVTKSVAIF